MALLGEYGRGRRRRRPQDGPRPWQEIFHHARVPMWVDDVSATRQALAEVRATGVEDLDAWLDGHPEFVMRAVGLIRVLEVNQGVLDLAGAPDVSTLLAGLDRLVVPATLTGFKDILKALDAGAAGFEGDSEYRTFDGRTVFTWNRGVIGLGPEHPDVMVVATADVTNLEITHQDLAHSEERYRLLVEAARDVILCHDLEGAITFVNSAGEALTGRAAVDLVGRPLDVVIGEADQAEMARRRSRPDADNATDLLVTRWRTAAGDTVPVEVSSSLMPGRVANGGEPRVLVLGRDISGRLHAERKQLQLEARLRDSQRIESLGVLAGGISHGFNNLLVGILGNAELARAEVLPDSPVAEQLDGVLEAAEQLAGLVRQIQAYAGHAAVAGGSSDLSRLLEEMSRLLQVSISGRATIRFELSENLPAIGVDESQIRQVVMNLVSNAAESFDQTGGVVVVRTACQEFEAESLTRLVGRPDLAPGRYVVCEVRDSGSGMDAATAARIFDPFFTTRTPGRGLGLFAALGIIQTHGGGVLLDTRLGQGTSVSFLLPVAAEVVEPLPVHRVPSVPRDRSVDLVGRRFLVVDDEPGVRAIGESFLRRLGCQVLSAGDGFDAVRIFSERHADIDAVILDLTMEGMDGVATCRRLRVIKPDVPVILSSGFDEEEVRGRGTAIEPFTFMPKPFRLAVMRRVLGEVLDPR